MLTCPPKPPPIYFLPRSPTPGSASTSVASAMKGTFFELLACVVCAWYLVRAVDAKARAEKPVEDDPLEVSKTLGVRVPGVAGCLATTAASYNVRIQSLNTSKGSVFSRQLVTTADFTCFKNSVVKQLPAATHIDACAEATAKEGLNSFLWEGDACTAYSAWRPRARANCGDGGSKVVYVVKKQLKPFAGGAPSNVAGSIRYDNSTSATLVISYDPSTCDVTDNKGFKLVWNGTQVTMVPQGVLEYSLNRRLLCYISTSISMKSIGSDGNVNGVNVDVPVDRTQIFWFGLSIGVCLYQYNDDDELNYNDTEQFCQRLGASFFVEETVGDYLAFAGALKEYLIQHPTTAIEEFFVGIKHDNAKGKWFWKGGRELTNANVWDEDEPYFPYTYNCAYSKLLDSQDSRLETETCTNKHYQGCVIKL